MGNQLRQWIPREQPRSSFVAKELSVPKKDGSKHHDDRYQHQGNDGAPGGKTEETLQASDCSSETVVAGGCRLAQSKGLRRQSAVGRLHRAWRSTFEIRLTARPRQSVFWRQGHLIPRSTMNGSGHIGRRRCLRLSLRNWSGPFDRRGSHSHQLPRWCRCSPDRCPGRQRYVRRIRSRPRDPGFPGPSSLRKLTFRNIPRCDGAGSWLHNPKRRVAIGSFRCRECPLCGFGAEKFGQVFQANG